MVDQNNNTADNNCKIRCKVLEEMLADIFEYFNNKATRAWQEVVGVFGVVLVEVANKKQTVKQTSRKQKVKTKERKHKEQKD